MFKVILMNMVKVKDHLQLRKIISIIKLYETVTLFQTTFEILGGSLGRTTECSGPELKALNKLEI